MAYLTYSEYEEYGGTVDEESFAPYEFRARKRIDYLTDCRVQKMQAVPEAVKLCMMQLIKQDSKFGVEAQSDNPAVASFNTDGYSESYGSVTEQASSVNAALDRTIRSLLYGEVDDEGTPLLYRGLNG